MQQMIQLKTNQDYKNNQPENVFNKENELFL